MSIVGYRLAEGDIVPSSEAEFEAKQAKELNKDKEKEAKKAENFDKEVKKLEYQRKLNQMDMETMIKIREREEYLEQFKNKKDYEGPTGG